MARNYPHAAVEMQGGELYTIEDVSVDEENGATAETTMRRAGAGISFGPVKCSVSFTVKNPSTPAERNWRAMVRARLITQLVIKYPDGTADVIDGAFSKRSFKDQEAGASKTTMDFVGFADDSDVIGAIA